MFYSSFMIFGLTFRSLIHLSIFLYMALENVLIHSFTRSCPVFPAPLIEEILFSLLFILAFFVVD